MSIEFLSDYFIFWYQVAPNVEADEGMPRAALENINSFSFKFVASNVEGVQFIPCLLDQKSQAFVCQLVVI